MLNVTFNNIQLKGASGYTISVKYHETLEEIVNIFNEQMGKSIKKVYNQYGQELPLTYRVQKTGLEIY